jgi:hypothetical protein
MRRLVVVAAGAFTLTAVWASPASAYEYVNGPGISCSSTKQATMQATTYGDYNMYSTYGLEEFGYNIPVNQETYVFDVTAHQSFSASAAEAENYVDGGIGVTCWP